MTRQLWTTEYLRITLVYLLLFAAFYMQLPILPLVMAERLALSVEQTVEIMLLFIPGLLLIGPLMSYLLDTYRRKSVAMFAFVLMGLVTAAFGFVRAREMLMLLCFVQGIAFQMASVAAMTLGIDVTNSLLRTEGNVQLVTYSRLGMLVGISSGTFVVQNYGFVFVLYVSLAVIMLGMVLLSRLYVPFRAPMSVSKYSGDRFFFLRGLVPSLNIVFFAALFGIMLPLHNVLFHQGLVVDGGVVPGFLLVVIGFILSWIVYHRTCVKGYVFVPVVLGVILFMIGLVGHDGDWSVLCLLMIGVGVGLAVPALLLLLIQLSQHCQRCTATASFQLASEIGILGGVLLAVHVGDLNIYRIGFGVASIGVLFFICITYPYYRMMRCR